MDELWYALGSWLYVGIVAVLLVVALVRKREPAAALAWSLAIVFIPIAGPVFFLIAGLNRVPRRVVRRVLHREEFDRRVMREGCDGMQPSTDETDDTDGADHADGPARRWAVLSRVIEELGEAPRRGGNTTELFCEGLPAYESAEAAIRAARHHVHIEFYILRDDDVGRRLIDLLVEKCGEGVQVRLVVDGFGSLGGFRLLQRVRRAGGQATSFLPLMSPGRISPNLRNHRKTIICDGHTAFFGGLNVGAEYLGRRGYLGRLQRRRSRRDAPRREWYDLHMRIQGPSVWDLQILFIEDWSFCTDELLQGSEYFPEPTGDGDVTAQVVAGGPYTEVNAIRQAYFTAITRARSRILIASPYLAPDLALREALKSSARSGVDVHVVTQSYPPDYKLVYYCGQFFTEELLEAGVRVYAYGPGMMHAKALAVDGEWAMLGTANLDNRSMALNFEQMTAFDAPSVVSAIDAELRRLVSRSTEFTAETMANRTRLERLLAAGARLFAPLL